MRHNRQQTGTQELVVMFGKHTATHNAPAGSHVQFTTSSLVQISGQAALQHQWFLAPSDILHKRGWRCRATCWGDPLSMSFVIPSNPGDLKHCALAICLASWCNEIILSQDITCATSFWMFGTQSRSEYCIRGTTTGICTFSITGTRRCNKTGTCNLAKILRNVHRLLHTPHLRDLSLYDHMNVIYSLDIGPAIVLLCDGFQRHELCTLDCLKMSLDSVGNFDK